MAKDVTITVRLPASLKRKIGARARKEHRSLSAQVVHDLERIADAEPTAMTKRSFLGRFEGGPVPSDDDFADVRKLLWGGLAADD